jgi:hypothetical protein
MPPDEPHPGDIIDDEPDNMSVLGKSLMTILNIAVGESVDLAMQTASNESIFSDIGVQKTLSLEEIVRRSRLIHFLGKCKNNRRHLIVVIYG